MIAGFLIGALAYRLLGPSKEQADKIKSDLDATRDELESYKASVNMHFNKTSDLVNDLTQNYVKVHQHLAEGAHSLGASKTFTNLLEQPGTGEPVAIDDEDNANDGVIDDSIVDPSNKDAMPLEAADEPAEVVEEVTDHVDIEASPEVEAQTQGDKVAPEGGENKLEAEKTAR